MEADRIFPHSSVWTPIWIPAANGRSGSRDLWDPAWPLLVLLIGLVVYYGWQYRRDAQRLEPRPAAGC